MKNEISEKEKKRLNVKRVVLLPWAELCYFAQSCATLH